MDCFFSDLMEKLDYETYGTDDLSEDDLYENDLYENEEQKPSKKEVKCFWKRIFKIWRKI